MRTSNHTIRLLGFLSLLLWISSCQKDNPVVYEVNPQDILSPTEGKIKEKSPEQFVAVLHANLFGTPISVSDQVEVERLLRSTGDKRLTWELLVSSYMNDPNVQLPDNLIIQNDMDGFIVETYNRFYFRPPSQIELEWWRNYLTNNPDVSTELVYLAFATSDEYFFY
tara:strand:+ start:161 stop:661 length:501 start_codon:yes stop_codon:yes gene_type:complete